MTEGTCKERLQVARLDRTTDPPGYVTWYDDEWGCCCYSTVADGASFNDEPIEDEAQAVAAAWAHYEREHDPPGMQVHAWGYGRREAEQPWWRTRDSANLAESRAAAWAWYWRRVGMATRVDAEVVVLVEHGDGGTSSRVAAPRSRVADALRPMLAMADDEDAREETIAEVERLFSEWRLTFEGDPPIELENVAAWPAALAWSDEQVAAVERWLAEGGEPPEVLRG